MTTIAGRQDPEPDVLKDIVMVADTQRERVTTSLVGQDRITSFEHDRVVVQRSDGTILETSDDPEGSFEGQTADSPWDAIHVAYFSGEALWTYLNTPFLYMQARCAKEEIGSIEVEGETWRRLKVTFPEEVKSHTREQIFCFGPDGLLRRHDYSVDILGGATGLNYASEYREVDGLMFPTKRRVYAYEGDYQLIPEPLLVAVDITQSCAQVAGCCSSSTGAPTTQTRRWQDRMMPLNIRIAHGCHCNRPTLDGIRAVGFDVTQLGRDELKHAPPFVRPLLVGIAVLAPGDGSASHSV